VVLIPALGHVPTQEAVARRGMEGKRGGSTTFDYYTQGRIVEWNQAELNPRPEPRGPVHYIQY
jgi:hypothetical protein